MSNRDTESLIVEVFELVKANLNTKILEIQAEKQALLGDDNFDLSEIDEAAWFTSLDEEEINYDPFVYYGVANQELISEHSVTATNVTLFFTVVESYHNQTSVTYFKMLRYIRALTEVVNEAFDKIGATSDLEVNAINPVDVRDIELDTTHKIGGIEITTSFA